MGSHHAVTLPKDDSVARPPRFLAEGLAEISARVDRAKRLAVLSDFDGTLAELAPTPELARMDPAMRDALLSLSLRDNVIVAILSGRALEDLRERVGIPELIYAGCHGLIINGGGLDYIHPQAQYFGPVMERLAEQVALRLQHISGVLVENKQLGISVHYRQVAVVDRDEVAKLVRTVVEELGACFRTGRGKEVLEIVPRVEWDKGSAARWILDRTSGTKDALPIVIGDDSTDEDAFQAVPEGITIKVGYSTGSAAAWNVSGTEEVRAFLLWLHSHLQ